MDDLLLKAHRELNAAITTLNQIAFEMPKEIKTVGKHDFTGYSEEGLHQALLILNEQGNLPGPLRVVQTALEGSYRLKTGREWTASSTTSLRGLIERRHSK